MRSAGLPPSLYGGHSLRIGGASAALAANVSGSSLARALEFGVLMPELEPFHDERWAVLHVCGQFVEDDCGGASIDDPLFDSLGRPMLDSEGVQVTRALVHLEIVEDVFDAFGHLSSPEKRVFGAQIDLLGVDLDLDSGFMRLSDNKRARYATLCRAVS